MANYGRTNQCTLVFQLDEVATGKTINHQTKPCSQIGNHVYDLFQLPSITDVKGKQYKITLSSPDAKASNAVTAFTKPQMVHPDQSLKLGNKVLPGGLAFDYTDNQEKYQLRKDLITHKLYKFKNSRGLYYTVNQYQLAQDDNQALDLLKKNDFDPYNVVILNADKNFDQKSLPISNQNQTLDTVEIIKDESTSTTLRVQRSVPGFLVITRPYYPGWKVKINSVEKSLLRADYAFNAIPLEANISIVEFYYDPLSFKVGAALSGITLVVGLVLSFYKFSRRKLKI